jgi:hypothetical protein
LWQPADGCSIGSPPSAAAFIFVLVFFPFFFFFSSFFFSLFLRGSLSYQKAALLLWQPADGRSIGSPLASALFHFFSLRSGLPHQ